MMMMMIRSWLDAFQAMWHRVSKEQHAESAGSTFIFVACTLQHSEIFNPHIPTIEVGVRAQGQPGYRPSGAEKVKALFRGPSVSLAVLGHKP